jgi:hypothetical protein
VGGWSFAQAIFYEHLAIPMRTRLAIQPRVVPARQAPAITCQQTFVPWGEPAKSVKVSNVSLGPGMKTMNIPSKSRSSRSPVVVSVGKVECTAITTNVSASGVLFELDSPLAAGAEIHFSLRMPGGVLGTPHDVLVHCQGRVVRCSISQTHYQAAATIDEYQFAEQ